MRKIILTLMVGLVLSSSLAFSKSIEQTICSSYLLSETYKLDGGSCNGKSLIDMNKNGWKLIQVVTGLNAGFALVFEKVK